MTKFVTENTDNEKCNNCHKSPKEFHNRELILKIIEDQISSQDKDRNEWKGSDNELSGEASVKRSCIGSNKKCSPDMQMIYTNNENYRAVDNSPANNYGSINPVVVINIFKDEVNEQIEKGGIINQAFLNEEETRFDLKVIPEVEEKQSDGSLKIGIPVINGDNSYGNSDKWRNSSKRSMASLYSHNSLHMKTMTPSRRRSSAITSNASEKRRESIRNMLFGDPELSLRRFSQDIRSTADEKEFDDEYETYKVIFLQVFVPFLIAGFGNVGAGLILDRVQHWEVFQSVTELFILVASFLGFKGNLEMTLAARLSTQANLGNLDKPSQQWKMGLGNIILIQCQAIVVALLAAIIAILVNIIKEWSFQADHCLLICATSLITASVTGLFLATLMIFVIIIARKTGVNPDNCSTLFAAFLGDISAVVMLALSARFLYMIRHVFWVAPTLIALFLIILPIFIQIAKNNEYTKDVIDKSWYPIIIAMLISSIGGFIFDFAVTLFETIAIFQPIINGVGANLVAVQSSRISTYLHQRCSLGEMPPNSCKVNTSICQLPQNVFVGSNTNVRTARLLLMMAVPGHILYILIIRLIKLDEVVLTVPFLAIYLLVALIQVSILLYIAHVLVPFLWTKKIDPDNSAIPGIMATGDLIGTALLTVGYMLLFTIGDPNALNKQLTEYKL